MTAATYLSGAPHGGPALALCSEHRNALAWAGLTMGLRGTPAEIALDCSACDAAESARADAAGPPVHSLRTSWRTVLEQLLTTYAPPTAADLAGLGMCWAMAYRDARGLPAESPSLLLSVARGISAAVFAATVDTATP
jgi:hypothetical protein